MLETAGVAIIGGGVIGLSVARALALRGVSKVTVLERGGLGGEASSAAAGMLAPQAEADSADDFFQLACKSRDMYAEFAAALLEETGIDVELEPTGTFYVGFTSADVAENEKRLEWQTKAGLRVEKVDFSDARRLEPAIAENVRSVLSFPNDVQVENRRLISALSESAKRYNISIVTGVTVESILFERDKVAGLQTSRGSISTDTVVVASGAWSSFLLNSDRRLPDIRIEPIRGQMICFESAPRLTQHVIYSPRGYLVPRKDGRLLAGSTSESVGFDKRVTVSGIHSILSHAMEIAPLVADLPITDFWAGLRPRARDGLPVLGPCAEIDGLFFAGGHYRNGILLAPITGELLADAIMEKNISSMLTAFAPDRFSLIRVN
jgi:glycine oxidase